MSPRQRPPTTQKSSLPVHAQPYKVEADDDFKEKPKRSATASEKSKLLWSLGDERFA